jgi:ribosomal protein S20
MPIIKSAKKRVKTTRKATARNARTKKSLRGSLKGFFKKPTASSKSKAESSLDKAHKKGLVHKNKVARKKKQLAKASKAAGVKPTTTKKAVAKRPVAKKAAPKKVAAKKPAAKKPAAKKPPAKKK